MLHFKPYYGTAGNKSVTDFQNVTEKGNGKCDSAEWAQGKENVIFMRSTGPSNLIFCDTRFSGFLITSPSNTNTVWDDPFLRNKLL